MLVGKKNYNIEKHTNNINTVYFINIAEDSNDNHSKIICHKCAK